MIFLSRQKMDLGKSGKLLRYKHTWMKNSTPFFLNWIEKLLQENEIRTKEDGILEESVV